MEGDPRQELIDRFIESVEFLNRQMRIGRIGEWQLLDMTIPQVKALGLLERLGPLRMGNLASSLRVGVSATTTIVDRLVEKDLVERLSDPNDRRVVICKLTELGQEAVSRFWRIEQERFQAIVDQLETELLASVVQALEVLCRVEREVL